jgi:hypothetical protein
MEEPQYRPALNSSRDHLRVVALEMKERADHAIADGAALRLYAKATFWATFALSAPEGNAPTTSDTPREAPAAPQPSTRSTFTQDGRVYDLDTLYVDVEGDTWGFSGNYADCGVPIMDSHSVDEPHTLSRVVRDWGPLMERGSATVLGGYCVDCRVYHESRTGGEQ